MPSSVRRLAGEVNSNGMRAPDRSTRPRWCVVSPRDRLRAVAGFREQGVRTVNGLRRQSRSSPPAGGMCVWVRTVEHRPLIRQPSG